MKAQNEYKDLIISQMRSLGTYKEEFSVIIETLAKMLENYIKALALFEENGSQIHIIHTNKAGKSNSVKNPTYLALETLRKQMLDYLKELGLTPISLKKITDTDLNNKASPLAKALKEIEKST